MARHMTTETTEGRGVTAHLGRLSLEGGSGSM